MKRIVWIVLAVAVVAGVGLWSLRFFGKSQIEGRLDMVAAEAEARGWTLTWGAREAEGFPMANRVRLSDVALVSKEGVLIKAGELIVARDEVAGAVAIRLSTGMTVTVPVGQMAREQNPILPERVEIPITSEDALLRVGQSDTGAAIVLLTAASLRAAVDQNDFPVKLAVDAGELTFESDPAQPGRRFRLISKTFGIDLRDTSGSGPSVLDSRYTDLSIGATLRAEGIDGFLAGLEAMSEKLMDGAFQSASQAITLSAVQSGGAPGRPSTLTWKAGPQTGIFQIDKGTLGYSAEDRDIRATLDLATARGSMTFDATALFYQRQFEFPIVSTGQPRSGSLRIAVEDFLPDAETWKALDPTGVLTRDPADLLFDADATLRRGGTTAGLPVEFSNVSLSALSLSALGAEVAAKGDVEILQPINLPLGQIDVVLSGAGKLIGELRAIGVLDDGTAQTADAILKVYARPTEDADRHETEFTFTRDGILINGRTTDGRTPGAAAGDRLDPTRPRDDGSPADTDAAPADGTNGGSGDGGSSDGAGTTLEAPGDPNESSGNDGGPTSDGAPADGAGTGSGAADGAPADPPDDGSPEPGPRTSE